MLAHGGHLPLVLLEVEVEVALLVAGGEHGVRCGPLQPGDLHLLVLKLQLVQQVPREGRPQEHRTCPLLQDRQHLVLVVPVDDLHPARVGQLLFDEHLAALVDDVDVLALGAHSEVGGVVGPGADGRAGAVDFLAEGEDLFAGGHDQI